MNVKKVVGWAIGIGLAWWLITDPVSAAHGADAALGAVKAVGNSLATFFTHL